MDQASLITFITEMFTILNPIGSVAIYAGMVANRAPADRRSVAIKSSIAVGVILITTVWLGETILRIFGVQIPSLQVAGGIMIASIALSMLRSIQSPIHSTKKNGDPPPPDQDISVVPLAMPMVAGPGSMVTVIVNTHTHRGVIPNLEMSAVCGLMAALICAGFLSAGPITRVLGTKGMDIVTKFMGMVLLAIAVSMFATGATGLMPGLAGMVPAAHETAE
ncbi:MarC family protein [Aeoliella mucimassa]|uniref:UPF0056 membrane protein n=1 Tax=Aeoliella mucimassa TaxID=2527972 RepID=A0A518ARF7_9BACT|nr:MarC family protein [Aeoliella mucimassa]QDU57303.1 hypothetical protein Pan181_35180 [Aeoliella mucimassa]